MRSLGLVLLSSTCLVLAACSSNTTIDAEDGTGGASGGAAGAPEGGTTTGGAAGAPEGGTTTGGTTTGGAATGGAATGGAATGGAATGGTGGTADTTVTGLVIDFWRHPLPGVPVEIGGTVVTTDAAGRFTVPDVAATYDASVLLDYTGNLHEIYGWVYLGLTRRDPTLQVYKGRPTQSGSITATLANRETVADQNLTFAFGGPDGSGEFDGVTASQLITSTSWSGSATTVSTAHGLLWQLDPSSDLPVSYTAYDDTTVPLSSTGSAEFTLDLTDETIDAANVTVQGSAFDGSAVDYAAFLRFDSGAAITLGTGSGSGGALWSVLVPTLTGSSISAVAATGDSYYGPYALAHADNLAPTNTVDLELPDPATLLTPAAGAANVTFGSDFSFVGGAGSGGAFVVAMVSENYYTGLYVVTAQTSFAMPEVVGGAYAFSPGDTIWWRVESHGTQSSVDEMAASGGFMDSFSSPTYRGTPAGPNRAHGTFSMSGDRAFITPL